MNIYWLTMIRILMRVLSAKIGGTALNLADEGLAMYATARAAVEAETGKPLDESKVPPFDPIP